MNWTKAEDQKLISLVKENKYLFTEIAEKLGRTPGVVRWHARRLGLPSTQKTQRHRLGKWNAKHAHLRLAVMTYFLNHTAEQCQKKFKLTKSEFKSLQSASYQMQEFRHLRKETRTHAPWSARELKFLLRHAGLRPRKWLAARLKRGNQTCMKERLQTLGLSSRTLQGITLSQFRQAFGTDPGFFLQTDAGPDGGIHGTLPTRWKVVPWVWLDQELRARRLRAPKVFRQLVATRAMFQEWIFEGNALVKMKRICAEARREKA